MKLAFVDTPEAASWALASGYDQVATDNPLLAGPDIINTDAAISQDEANILGMVAIELADEIDDVLRGSELLRDLALPLEDVRLGGASSRLLSALLHRGLAASKSISEDTRQIGLGVIDQPFLGPDGISLARLHNPLQTLADAGFFGDSKVMLKTFSGPRAVRKDPDVPQQLLRRFIHLPPFVFAFEMISKAVKKLPSPRGTIYVLGENEALRETLPWLALAGHAPTRMGKVKTTSTKPPRQVQLPGNLADVVRRRIGEVPSLRSCEQAALVVVVSQWIAGVLGRLAADWPSLRQGILAQFTDMRPIVLSNGLFGPSGRLTYAALKAANATVVDFEHGVTTGLSAHSQKKIAFSEAATCDVLLCCSEAAAAGFKASPHSPVRRIEAMGLADQTRHLSFPSLQRHLARKTFGFRSAETVVLHVSTWPLYGNMRPGYGTPTETINIDTERALLTDVYAGLRHHVVYKPYPTERFAHQPHVQERIDLASNISLSPPEDLRYVRAAADVIVTHNPTSTLGWVVGANVPIVWLASRKIFPIEGTDNEADIAGAFLNVDIDQPDWTHRLRSLLDRPLTQLQADWRAKTAVRHSFYRRAIKGPDGSSGRRAAKIIRELIKESQKA